MSAQLLIDVPVEDTEKEKHLRVISRAKDRMNRLIQDLVDVARMKGGKSLSVEILPDQLGSVIHEACEAVAESTREKTITLECHVPDDVPDVMIDHRRIIQVLSNLLGNALKFTPAGGRIELRAEENAEHEVQVSVRDSGPGIPPEDLKRVFEAFWQAPRTTRLGAGLGLAISRGIVQLHGGRIWGRKSRRSRIDVLLHNTHRILAGAPSRKPGITSVIAGLSLPSGIGIRTLSIQRPTRRGGRCWLFSPRR